MAIQYIERKDGVKLAYCHTEATVPELPTVMFLGGYRSDMAGTKALYLEEQCRARGQGYVRFDYSGHGESGGKFEDGMIGVWKDDALAVLDQVIDGGQVVLVGSSMGGWIALLLALERPQQLAGLCGIAAAPDFTRTMYEEEFDEAQRQMLDEQGFIHMPNDYSDEPYLITKNAMKDSDVKVLLIESGDHRLSRPEDLALMDEQVWMLSAL